MNDDHAAWNRMAASYAARHPETPKKRHLSRRVVMAWRQGWWCLALVGVGVLVCLGCWEVRR